MSQDLRDLYISEVVRGKTFAEIGGLWGTVNERVSVAHGAGASSLTMLDVFPEGDDLWSKFRQRMHEWQVPSCQCISGDVYAAIVGPFDVIHCSGVLYHLPNPILFLAKLHSLVKEHVVLTSAIVPGRISNRFGVLKVNDSAPMFVPAMSDGDKKIYAEFYTNGDDRTIMWGINRELPFALTNYAPWWWLLPVPCIRQMCNVCGLTVVRDGPNWDGKAHTFLLRKRT